MTHRLTLTLWLLSALLLAACPTGPQSLYCTQCGSNSPVVDSVIIDGVRFHELSLTAENDQGFVVEDASAQDVLKLRRGDRHYVLHLKRAPDEVGPRTMATYWLSLDSGENVCGEGKRAVLFTGDRIDAERLTVSPAVDHAWLNLGCEGHTLWKLQLTGSTAITQPDWRRRQAMLKMLAADYCGTGRPFTVAGAPLVWKTGDEGYASMPRSLEARWSERGTSCLEEPRLVHAGAPDLWAEVARECTLPRCQDRDPLHADGELVTSANPE